MIIEWPALTPVDVFLRILCMFGFVVIAALLMMVLAESDGRWLRGLAAAGAAVLLVHGQIEMTFFQSASVVWAMCVLGLLGDARPARSRMISRVCGLLVSVVLLVSAGWLLWGGAIPASAQESMMLDAARLLAPIRKDPVNEEIMLRQRPLVAERLVEAYREWPINVQPLNGAADQLMFATTHPDRPPPLGLVWKAQGIIDWAVHDHDKPPASVLAMNVHAALASVTDDNQEWAQAIALGRRMTEIDPRGVSPWQRLGDVLWAAGERQEAAKAYHMALVNSDNFALDDMKQLSAAKRAAIQARIDRANAPPPASAPAGEDARR